LDTVPRCAVRAAFYLCDFPRASSSWHCRRDLFAAVQSPDNQRTAKLLMAAVMPHSRANPYLDGVAYSQIINALAMILEVTIWAG
jgi:hypothetical protein